MKTNRDIVDDYNESIDRFSVEINELNKIFGLLRFDPNTPGEKVIKIACHIDALTQSRDRAKKWRDEYAKLPANEEDWFRCPF